MLERFDDDARWRVISLATEEVKRRGDQRLGTEHLLLARLHGPTPLLACWAASVPTHPRNFWPRLASTLPRFVVAPSEVGRKNPSFLGVVVDNASQQLD
jgi:hypothetical protein